jgi:hypothetical protein
VQKHDTTHFLAKSSWNKADSYRELVKDKRCHRIVVWKEDSLIVGNNEISMNKIKK